MTGGRCAVREGRLEVDGRPFFVYSGEIHYFRVDPAEWPDRLRKAKRAGLNTVSSYIPWRWHERTEKKFDFTGRTHPARNLVRWMDEIVKAGLFFIARIGPVSNAELIREGLPDWLMEKYHEVHLAGRPGENEANWRQAGVKSFIFMGCDVLSTLQAAHDILAVK